VISFREYIAEALLEVDVRDINMIYAPFAKPFREMQDAWKKSANGKFTELTWAELEKWRLEREFREVMNKYGTSGKPLKVFESSQLKSDLAKQAHEVNPVTIYTHLIGDGNMYTPTKSTIYISLQAGAYFAMSGNLAFVPFHQIAMLRNETLDVRVKSTIRHELTHWLDDSLHNFYITKALKATQQVKQDGGDWNRTLEKTLYNGEIDAYLGAHEINAAVNQIAEVKRRISKAKWDKMTYQDLLTMIPSLDVSNERLGAPFRRKLFTRMAREDLLGLNMRA